jgi:hypothetical protein
MNIEALNVSQQCFSQLQRAGFTTIEEIIEFLDNNWGAMPIESKWLLSSCFDEVIDRIKAMGVRLKHEGQNWDGTMT